MKIYPALVLATFLGFVLLGPIGALLGLLIWLVVSRKI